MIIVKAGEKELHLATTLRVVYALKEISKANTLQAALNSIQKLDLDGQLKFLYAAYKAYPDNSPVMSFEEFEGIILDTQGIFALTEIINKLTEDLLYAGLSDEQRALKKAEVEKTLPGTASFDKDID